MVKLKEVDSSTTLHYRGLSRKKLQGLIRERFLEGVSFKREEMVVIL